MTTENKHTHARTHARTHTRTHAHTHTRTHAHTHTRTRESNLFNRLAVCQRAHFILEHFLIDRNETGSVREKKKTPKDSGK